MKIPTLQGIIKRRILVNYRAQPKAIQKILPPCFRPKLHVGRAVAGICLIRLEHIRPKYAPEFVGISSENAAHRIAVLWEDESGERQEGVYIPRRDTNSFINHVAGGALFPGEHNAADFKVTESEREINFAMRSKDGAIEVKLTGEVSENLPENSIFSSIAEASEFFEKGSLGYSVTKDGKELDGITLQIRNWKVEALNLDAVESNYYENENAFPKGSIEFDYALLMRNIAHEWHIAPSFELK
ncbi:MAG: DUF2071 domain-containing protein [Acidobacteria bacterium]|nr:DUF2071 domain-containing protein [Acidobacteriota bacterium]